jgi:N-acetylglucosamine-6-phosphate deacetylase
VTVLAASRIANGEGGISASPAWLIVEDERIVASGTGAAPAGDVEDLGDAVLAPGFIDLQVNGTGTVDFATASLDACIAALDAMTAGGCTACLPTVVTAPLDSYDDVLRKLDAVRAARPAQVVGVHLEGPFLGGAPGAHPAELVRTADLGWLGDVCERFDGLVRLVTLAPEADPGLEATRALTKRGVIVALGHSIVDYDGARAAADAGARMVTHLFNGMGPLHHREPGLPGAALDDRRLVPSVIADFVHVHRAMVKLALDARPDAVLVTDAVGTSASIEARDGAAYLTDGTLAGSTLTMADAVRNVASLGLPLPRVVRHATANAARVLGMTDRGRIAPGARADLVALDPATLSPRRVWLGGRPLAR